MEKKELDICLYDILLIREYLPKGYRLRAKRPKRTWPKEKFIILFDETVVIQHRDYEYAKFLGFLYKRKKWVDVGEFQLSWFGMTPVPEVTIYRGCEKHSDVVKRALAGTPFKAHIEGKKAV